MIDSDLSVETDLDSIAISKRDYHKANLYSKPVIVATEMSSMIDNFSNKSRSY